MKTAAIDIETTGTAPEDQITVMGVDIPMGSRVFLNTGERTYPEAITDRVDQDFDSVVQITAHDCEAALLEAFRSFALQRFGGSRDSRDDEFKFAAYNGETWKGGFDLPFIRTRCQSHGVGWPLHGPYIDVMEVVGNRFKVVQPEEILEFYRDLTEVSGFELETAGVLKGGRKMWALARTGQSGMLKGNDQTNAYVLLATACDGTMATTAQFTSIRVVCNNTLAVALKGSTANVVKVKHTTAFDADLEKKQPGISVLPGASSCTA